MEILDPSQNWGIAEFESYLEGIGFKVFGVNYPKNAQYKNVRIRIYDSSLSMKITFVNKGGAIKPIYIGKIPTNSFYTGILFHELLELKTKTGEKL